VSFSRKAAYPQVIGRGIAVTDKHDLAGFQSLMPQSCADQSVPWAVWQKENRGVMNGFIVAQ
jgi:protocatechuate 3,4-dioxygenase beta subunit